MHGMHRRDVFDGLRVDVQLDVHCSVRRRVLLACCRGKLYCWVHDMSCWELLGRWGRCLYPVSSRILLYGNRGNHQRNLPAVLGGVLLAHGGGQYVRYVCSLRAGVLLRARRCNLHWVRDGDILDGACGYYDFNLSKLSGRAVLTLGGRWLSGYVQAVYTWIELVSWGW